VPDQLAQACAQFEALMLRQMLTDSGIARSTTLGDDGGLDSSEGSAPSDTSGADFVQSMFVDTLAQTVAEADRSGLGHMLEISLRGIPK
jgi:Rod binding domain-containing protein